MKNAHLRMGSLRFTKVLRDTTIDITLRMDRMIAEHAADNRSAQCHLLSLIGNDQEIAAIAAAIADDARFYASGPEINRLMISLGSAPMWSLTRDPGTGLTEPEHAEGRYPDIRDRPSRPGQGPPWWALAREDCVAALIRGIPRTRAARSPCPRRHQGQQGPGLTLSVAYRGSSGHCLPGAGNLGPMTNQIPLQYITLGSLLGQTLSATTLAQAQAVFPNIGIPFPNFTGTIAQVLKPFPQYSGISNPWANLGISTYNSLQTTLTRRFSQGLTFTLAYTFSKQLDDLVGTPRNPFNDGLERGPGTIDHPQVGSFIFVYQLPFGAGHKLNSGTKMVSAALSHWQISGLVTYTSGAPLVIGGTCA